jgi:hypothetical protein
MCPTLIFKKEKELAKTLVIHACKVEYLLGCDGHGVEVAESHGLLCLRVVTCIR